MKNNRMTKTSLGIFSLAVLSLGLGISCLSGTRSVSRVSADGNTGPLDEAIDPTHYEELSTENFVASVKDCTGTSLSRRYQVQFESRSVKAFQSQRKEIFSVVDDPNYSETPTDPFVDPSTPKGSDLNGYIYHAEATSSTKNQKLYFHNRLKYGSFFSILNTRIASNCMSSASDYNGLTTIYITNSYEVVDSGAFVNVPTGVTIQIEFDAIPAGWAADWTDADPSQIQLGVALDSSSERNAMTNQTKSFGEAKDYILGYYGYEGKDYPLIMKYDKENANGDVSTEYVAIPKKHLTNPYDAVGTSIGSLSNTFNVPVDLDYNEEIVDDSLEFYNIFNAIRQYNDQPAAWPTADFDRMYEFYNFSAHSFPALDGEIFTHQLYENDTEVYLTVASHAASDAAAQELVDQYATKLLAILGSDDEPIFVLDTAEFKQADYGDVYKAQVVTSDDKVYALFAQLYVYDSHFISYFVINELVPNFDEEGNQRYSDAGTPDDPSDDYPLYNYSHTLPISKKKAAVRPFKWVPDINESTYEGFYKAEGFKKYNHITFIDNIFDIKYSGSSKFIGYTSIGAYTTKKFVTTYGATLVSDPTKNVAVLYDETTDLYYNGAGTYDENELNFIGSFRAPEEYILNNNARSNIEKTFLNSLIDGTIYFRYTLANLNNSYLVIKYRSGADVVTKRANVVSPNPVVELSSDTSNFKLLVNNSDIQGVNSKDILALGIAEVTVNIHLYNKSTKNVISNTELLKIFGNIEILPYSNKDLAPFNIDLYIILFAVILTGVYAVGAVILFFYQKNKYKNDEFRRIRPKQFIKTAIASYIGLVLLSLAINFIVLRFGVFYSTIPVFNPIDPFVIAFAIAGAISLGLFIRMFVIMHKQHKVAKETKRLHLDKDVVDDGTK